MDGAEVEGEMEFLGDVFLLVGAVPEEGGVLGEVGGLAPGQAELDFELVIAAGEVSKGSGGEGWGRVPEIACDETRHDGVGERVGVP